MIKYSLEDKIIVTGASSGIGLEIAHTLNRQGATVIAIGRNSQRLELAKINSSNKKHFYTEIKDLTENLEELPQYISHLREKYGQFKALVYSAGIVELTVTRLLDKNIIDRIFNINFSAPLLTAKGFLDKKNNIGAGSSIVFIASVAGVKPSKGQIVYSSSKAALISASKSMSQEFSNKKIRINCISPAWVKTPVLERQINYIGVKESDYPLGFGQTSDVANLASFLLSDESKWITGQNYILDGGGNF